MLSLPLRMRMRPYTVSESFNQICDTWTSKHYAKWGDKKYPYKPTVFWQLSKVHYLRTCNTREYTITMYSQMPELKPNQLNAVCRKRKSSAADQSEPYFFMLNCFAYNQNKWAWFLITFACCVRRTRSYLFDCSLISLHLIFQKRRDRNTAKRRNSAIDKNASSRSDCLKRNKK